MSTDKPLVLESLPGEAPRDRYGFVDADRRQYKLTDAVFPIFKHLQKGILELVGTGFFICDNGVFVTARHVLKDAFDEDGNLTHGLSLMHLVTDGHTPSEYVIRPIVRFATHWDSDIAVGVPLPATNQTTGELITNKVLGLSMKAFNPGDKVITYAYPNTRVESGVVGHNVHCFPAFYEGHVEEFWPKGKGGKLNGNCYQTSISIHGGASGGPVFGPSGYVHAINSSSFAGMPDLSFVTRINEILFLDVRDVFLPESKEPMTAMVVRLAKRGCIVFDEPIMKLDLGDMICDVGPDGELTVGEQG